jgi:hypothetical protein
VQIVEILDIMKPESFQKYEDVYIVNELMNTSVEQRREGCFDCNRKRNALTFEFCFDSTAISTKSSPAPSHSPMSSQCTNCDSCLHHVGFGIAAESLVLNCVFRKTTCGLESEC